MRKYFFLFLICIYSYSSAQELLAEVTVDYSQVQGSSNTAYTALEKSLKDFINTTKWTNLNYKVQEKIECNFTIVINQKIGSNNYSAKLLVQSRRPVYGTNYHTPILNINDTNFDFEYTEYEQLFFNPRKFSGKNLTDVIGYYIYLVLGYDADTFARKGGSDSFQIAQSIASYAESSQYGGWSTMSGPRSRSGLINSLLAPKNETLRAVYYDYHRKGLDVMIQNELNGKNAIGKSLMNLEQFQKSNNYAQNYPLDIFFQAKKSEIANIFSGGLQTTVQTTKLKSLLNTISPTNSDQWDQIK